MERFEKAVVKNNIKEVNKILDKDPQLVNIRFKVSELP